MVQELGFFIQHLPVTKKDIDAVILCIDIGQILETARKIAIISILPTDEITSGALESFIYRMTLSAIRLAYPKCHKVLVSPYQIQTAVRAATINDDKLDIRIALQKNRANRLFEVSPVIEGWYDHRNPGRRRVLRITRRSLGPRKSVFAFIWTGKIVNGKNHPATTPPDQLVNAALVVIAESEPIHSCTLPQRLPDIDTTLKSLNWYRLSSQSFHSVVKIPRRSCPDGARARHWC